MTDRWARRRNKGAVHITPEEVGAGAAVTTIVLTAIVQAAALLGRARARRRLTQSVELLEKLDKLGSQSHPRAALQVVIDMCSDILFQREQRWVKVRMFPWLSELAGLGAVVTLGLAGFAVSYHRINPVVRGVIAALGFVIALALVGVAMDLWAIRNSAAAYRQLSRPGFDGDIENPED